MRSAITLALLSGLMLTTTLPAFGIVKASASLGAATDEEVPHAEDHVLVKLRPGAQVQALVPNTESVYDRWREVPVPPGKTPQEVVDEMAGRPDVELAELDYEMQLEPGLTPVALGDVGALAVPDPLAGLQWHFPLVQVASAWTESTGQGVVVAIIDTGVSQGGEDLDCHTFVYPYNAITETAGASAAEDDNGHGTHVAGTVAQCTNNGIGVTGIAYDAQLMPVKVLDAGGTGLVSSIAQGVDWAREHGADVINLSLGGCCASSVLTDAIDAAHDAGIVIVAAAGNSGSGSIPFPASHPDVIAVGAVDYNRDRTFYSNGGSALELVAPGGDNSQDANGDGHVDGVLQETFELDGMTKTFGYYFLQGTSMATPHVTGAVALMLSLRPEASPQIIRSVLDSTAQDLGAPGFDTSYGHGLLQIGDALDELANRDTAAPTWATGARLYVDRYGENDLVLSWDDAGDNVGVTGYRLRLVGTSGFDVAGTTTPVTGLSPGTAYRFEVVARDESGNWSLPLTAVLHTARHFTDIAGQIFHQDILWLSGEDVTRGCNPPVNDEFCPDKVLTRQTMSAFLVRALGLSANTHASFIDVPTGSVFAEDIGRLATAGITRGCNPPDNDEFCPSGPVTRAALAAFLVRALGLEANTHAEFVDVPAGSVFAEDIGRLATAGITQGCNPPDNDRFCPDGLVTRGQLAAFLHRALSVERP
ncbi:MAG: S8 family serine peptidase [Acidimicrobiia bacterium]